MYPRYNTKIQTIFFEITQDFPAESLISIKDYWIFTNTEVSLVMLHHKHLIATG